MFFCVNGLGRVDQLYAQHQRHVLSRQVDFYTQLHAQFDGTLTERDRHGIMTTNSYAGDQQSSAFAKLTRISDRNGNQMTFQYNADGQLTNITDTLDRPIAYRYAREWPVDERDGFCRSARRGSLTMQTAI